MTIKQNTLLAGVAALALLAGAGLATAQDTKGHAGGAMGGPATGGAPAGAASQPAARGESGAAGGATQNAPGAPDTANQAEAPAKGNAPGATGHSAQESGGKDSGGKDSAIKSGRDENRAAQGQDQKQDQKSGATTQQQQSQQQQPRDESKEQPKSGGSSTAQEQRGNEPGRPGAATAQGGAGANVKLSDDQRSQIRKTVIDVKSAPRVTNVTFNVSVGTVVPREHVHVVPVPETLVEFQPEWRGFMYFVYQDEIVVVDPNDMRIIAVLDV
jgi:hypothetical protein